MRCLNFKCWNFACLYIIYRQASNISRTLVGSKIVDHPDVVGASPVDTVALLQLHLHSELNSYLQSIGQRQLQYEMGNI